MAYATGLAMLKEIHRLIGYMISAAVLQGSACGKEHYENDISGLGVDDLGSVFGKFFQKFLWRLTIRDHAGQLVQRGVRPGGGYAELAVVSQQHDFAPRFITTSFTDMASYS